jgi:hypothetical protein
MDFRGIYKFRLDGFGFDDYNLEPVRNAIEKAAQTNPESTVLDVFNSVYRTKVISKIFVDAPNLDSGLEQRLGILKDGRIRQVSQESLPGFTVRQLCELVGEDNVKNVVPLIDRAPAKRNFTPRSILPFDSYPQTDYWTS